MRLAATTGTTLDSAWAIIARRHCRDVSSSGSWGSVPFAVGTKGTCAPVRIFGLKEAGWDPDAEGRGARPHRPHRRMLARRPGVGEQALILDFSEVGALEQSGRKHGLRALAGRLTHQLRHGSNVGNCIVA